MWSLGSPGVSLMTETPELWVKRIDRRNRFWRVMDWLLSIHYFDAQRMAVSSTFGFRQGMIIDIGGTLLQVARIEP